MRVTLGTVNGHPQQVTGDHLDRVEQDTGPDICRVQFLLARRVGCLPEKTGCHQVVVDFISDHVEFAECDRDSSASVVL